MSTPETRAQESPPFTDESREEETPTSARDRIFQAARSLFYRYGIRGVSVDQIAAEAATTKVTLYRVFASKDDLVIQVLEDHVQRFWQWWDSVVTQFPGKPRKQIEALLATFKDRICGSGIERGCPVANAAVEIVDADHPASAIIREYKSEITRRLRALCSEMGARQPELLGDSLSLLISGALASRLCCDDTKQVASVYEAAQALLDSPAIGVARKR